MIQWEVALVVFYVASARGAMLTGARRDVAYVQHCTVAGSTMYQDSRRRSWRRLTEHTYSHLVAVELTGVKTLR
jgi:hypothetical protein